MFDCVVNLSMRMKIINGLLQSLFLLVFIIVLWLLGCLKPEDLF